MALAIVSAIFVFLAFPLSKDVVGALATTAAFYFPLLGVGRLCFQMITPILGARHRVLIVEPNDLGIAVARELLERPGLGLEPVGFLCDRLRLGATDEITILGHVGELEKVVVDRDVGMVVVATTARSDSFPDDALLALKLRGVRVESGEDLYERITGRIYSPRAEGLIFSTGFRQHRIAEMARRSMDVVGAAFALLVATPILLLCAVAIKIESKGPILYWQIRVGRRGREFKLAKLRSMNDGAEACSGPVFAEKNDDRITRVGRLLRLSRLDEVPQFWNVLIGDMSLVGPRPERPEFVEMLSECLPLFRFRSAIKPGVTGWAQVRFGYVNEMEAFEQKLALDLFYMKHRSIALDLLVIGNTIKTVLSCRGL